MTPLLYQLPIHLQLNVKCYTISCGGMHLVIVSLLMLRVPTKLFWIKNLNLTYTPDTREKHGNVVFPKEGYRDRGQRTETSLRCVIAGTLLYRHLTPKHSYLVTIAKKCDILQQNNAYLKLWILQAMNGSHHDTPICRMLFEQVTYVEMLWVSLSASDDFHMLIFRNVCWIWY